jgi:iron complex outermembrane receptor protein
MSLLLALLCCLQDPVPAEKPKSSDPAKSVESTQDKQESGKKVEKEVVITAQRRVADVLDVPAGVTVVTGAQIQESGAANMVEVVQRQPGFFSQGQVKGAYDQVVDLRGYNNGSGNGQRTLVLVDGRKTNSVAGSSTDWASLPLDNIDRVEIIRGPAAAIYGDTALAGVINIITKKASKDPSASLTVSGGAWSTFSEAASVSGSLEAFKADAFIADDRTHGYRQHSAFHGITLGARGEYSEDPSLHAFVKVGHHEDDRERPGSLTQAEMGTVGRRGTVRTGNAHLAEHYVDLGLDSHVDDVGELSVFANYTHDNGNSMDDEFAFGIVDRSEIWMVQLKHVIAPKIFSMETVFTTGVDFSYETAGATSGNIVFGFADANYIRRLVGIYEQIELRPIPAIIISGGARFDRASFTLDRADMFGTLHVDRVLDQWSPQGGVTFRVVEPLSLFGSAGRTFKYPTRDELVGFTATDPQLQPEIASTYQGGVRVALGSTFSGEVLYYKMNVRDEIFFDPTFFGPFGSNINFGRVTHSGVETQARAALAKWLELFGEYTFTQVVINEALDPTQVGKSYSVTPRHAASAGLTVKQGGVSFSLDARYAGKRLLIGDFTNAAAPLPDYVVYNARLSYTWKLLTAFVSVYNFTNRLYFDSGGVNGAGNRFNPAPERSWLVGFDLRL